MIICISGFHGTGKTTVGKKVAQRLNLDYYSTGQAFRDLAKEYEMNLKDFSKYVEDNPDIDKKLDHKVIQMAQRKDDIVLESLLSGYILQGKSDCSILLKAPLEIRVKRMVERDNSDFKEKLKETKIREKSEIQRFIDLYNIDLTDRELRSDVFDLIIDTGNLSVEEVVEKIIEYLEKQKII